MTIALQCGYSKINYEKSWQHLNTRISDELNNNLLGYAKELDRPKGYIAFKALENYLQELREDREDIRIAVSRRRDPNKNFIVLLTFKKN